MTPRKHDKAVLKAAEDWANADRIARSQPFGTSRNVWRETAERLAIDVFIAARARHETNRADVS